MAGDGLELPIFELPVVILPGELLPLHIFEERYKRMIGHCLDHAEPFGIVFRDDDGTAHRIGCTARVTEVLERFDDGRMNIVVTGEQPFRVLERFEGADYPEGEIEPITPEEEPDEEDPDAADMARQARPRRPPGATAHPPRGMHRGPRACRGCRRGSPRPRGRTCASCVPPRSPPSMPD